MNKTYKITGNNAILLAERENLTIQCHANPIDDGGPVTAAVARQIAKEDASLIYVNVTPTGWRDGNGNHCDGEGRTVEAYFNSYNGEYLGPDDDGVEPCWDDASVSNPEDALVCGTQIQIDRSGTGSAWRDISAADIPAAVREEIEGEILDGGRETVDLFVASNGVHYRW